MIDKEQFGAFVAQLRKERNLTQKALAEQLYLSDKAVSKWERGLSLPDVAILGPLSDALGVTVTELLEGRRLPPDNRTPQQVEELVRRAVSMGQEEEHRFQKENLPLWLLGLTAAAAIALGGGLLEGSMQYLSGSTGMIMVLCGVFSGFFWLYVPRRLSRYYDENRISAFSDGPLRINLPGVAFNNRNWPRIHQYVRWWSLLCMWAVPVLWLVGSHLAPSFWPGRGDAVLAAMMVLSILLPLWYLGKMYQ